MKQTPRSYHLQHNRQASYWRAKAILALRQAGHTHRMIGEYFNITPERVRQICWRTAQAAQLNLPLEKKP